MIDFLEKEHIYLKDGMIIPSVSEILHFIFPDKYKGVPKNVLNKKADYGTKVHESIEQLEEYGNLDISKLNIYQQIAIEQYIKLKNKFRINVLEQEQIVSYNYDFCGRFDMIANINNQKCLCDIKTTTELDVEYLSWQLSFYELAYGEKFDNLYAIWLPKKKLGQLVKIERKNKSELLKKIDEFKKSKEREEE